MSLVYLYLLLLISKCAAERMCNKPRPPTCYHGYQLPRPHNGSKICTRKCMDVVIAFCVCGWVLASTSRLREPNLCVQSCLLLDSEASAELGRLRSLMMLNALRVHRHSRMIARHSDVWSTRPRSAPDSDLQYAIIHSCPKTWWSCGRSSRGRSQDWLMISLHQLADQSLYILNVKMIKYYCRQKCLEACAATEAQ